MNGIIIVGAGIMGVTLATLLKELDDKLTITIIERLAEPAAGNTAVFNNAGTGHEANCEFNYTPVDEGVADISKALKIHAQFNLAKQFWAYLVSQGIVKNPASFIHSVKHVTIVQEQNIDELKKRYNEMAGHHFFDSMQYTQDHTILQEWVPLIMQNRSQDGTIAATMIQHGTDINFESLTKQMLAHLTTNKKVTVQYNSSVIALKKINDKWIIKTDTQGNKKDYSAHKVFIGAGGGAFQLLKQSGIPERKQYTAFPVGGYFLSSEVAPEVAQQYSTKAYSKAAVGAPPMSVPHLDIRHINNKHYLLFGPFATFACKPEKDLSFFDYLSSLRIHDLIPLLKVAKDNIHLLQYLIRESLKTTSDLKAELEDFAPGITTTFNWQLLRAGQRVQIIKNAQLQMGTEMVFSQDKSLSVLLGASPGASTSPDIMLNWVKQTMPDLLNHEENKIKQMFAVQNTEQLITQADLYRTTRDKVNSILNIQLH